MDPLGPEGRCTSLDFKGHSPLHPLGSEGHYAGLNLL